MDKNVVLVTVRERFARKDVLDVLRCRASVKKALLGKGYAVTTLCVGREDFVRPSLLVKRILSSSPACVFNLFEGFGDDSSKEAEFVRLLEKASIPFTGNSSRTIRTCLDKEKVRIILKRNRIPVPDAIFIKQAAAAAAAAERKKLTFPLFVKPCFEDASLGIDRRSLVADKEDLAPLLKEKLKRFPRGLVLEEFIPSREYSASFMSDYPYVLLGISVIDYSRKNRFPPFLTYESKWMEEEESFKGMVPDDDAFIEPAVRENMVRLARKTAGILGCRSYFRIDMRERGGRVFILDVNPNPDINTDSGFVKQAARRGYSYEDTIEMILKKSLQIRGI